MLELQDEHSPEINAVSSAFSHLFMYFNKRCQVFLSHFLKYPSNADNQLMYAGKNIFRLHQMILKRRIYRDILKVSISTSSINCFSTDGQDYFPHHLYAQNQASLSF